MSFVASHLLPGCGTDESSELDGAEGSGSSGSGDKTNTEPGDPEQWRLDRLCSDDGKLNR